MPLHVTDFLWSDSNLEVTPNLITQIVEYLQVAFYLYPHPCLRNFVVEMESF